MTYTTLPPALTSMLGWGTWKQPLGVIFGSCAEGAGPSRGVPGRVTLHRCGGGELATPQAAGKRERRRGRRTRRVKLAGFSTPPVPRARGVGRTFLQPPTRPIVPPELWELTQDHRCEERQLFPPGFRFCPHRDQDTNATVAAADPGTDTVSPTAALGLNSGRQVEPSPALPSAPDWSEPRPCTLPLVERAAAPVSGSPSPGAAPPTAPRRARLAPFQARAASDWPRRLSRRRPIPHLVQVRTP